MRRATACVNWKRIEIEFEINVWKNRKGNDMQKITPFLWFDNQAEEAVKFYTSIFKNSKVGKIARYTKREKRFLDDRQDR